MYEMLNQSATNTSKHNKKDQTNKMQETCEVIPKNAKSGRMC